MDGILYHSAFDENGNVVDIDTIKPEERHSHSYTCIACGAELIPRLGHERAKHFAHKVDSEHCSSETYLHKLAKLKLKQKFDRDSEFCVQYYRDVKCSDKGICSFYCEASCHKKVLKCVDLKKHYDTCEEEKPVDGFVADLLLTKSDVPKRPPVLLEINVTHESSDAKKRSGKRIIEIGITSEDDIHRLLDGPITELNGDDHSWGRRKHTMKSIEFYGFKRFLFETEPLNERQVSKFYLLKNGKPYVNQLDDIRHCRESRIKDDERAIFEVSIDSDIFARPSLYDYGYLLARENGIQVKTCQFCKYHKDGYITGMGSSPIFCCLHKKYGTPENPESRYAKNCEYYREDIQLLKIIKATMPPYQVSETTDAVLFR